MGSVTPSLVHVTGEGGKEECQMDEELVDEIESVDYRPATRLHFVHEIAVPISWSPQHS